MQSGKELKAFFPTLVLLCVAVLINYADRGNLALAAPILQTEWHLSASQLGILLSTFFWSYMALQIPVGWLVDRFNVNVVLALGFVIWSLSTAASGLATGFAMMLCMRLLLGIGEAVMFPATSKICSLYLPERSRGLVNAIIMASIRWGTAAGTFAGGLLMAFWGWRRTFLFIGLAGLLWIPAWMAWQPRRRAEQELPALEAGTAQASGSIPSIVRLPSFWATATGHFCANYLLYFFISWLPYYLVHERKLSMQVMAGTAALLYSIDSLSAIATGWVADRRIRGGGDACQVRKWSMAAGFAIATCALLGCATASSTAYTPLLALVALGSGMAASGPFAVGQTLAGPRLSGRWIGLQNCVANVSGVGGPALTGFIVDRTGNFDAAFALAAGVAAVGALAWIFGIRRALPAETVTAPAVV